MQIGGTSGIIFFLYKNTFGDPSVMKNSQVDGIHVHLDM